MVISHKSSFVNTPKNICVAWLLTHKKATTMGKKAIKPGHGHGHVTNWVINMNQFYFAAIQLNSVFIREKKQGKSLPKGQLHHKFTRNNIHSHFFLCYTQKKKKIQFQNVCPFSSLSHQCPVCVFRCASFNIFVVNQAIENSAMHTV